MANDNLAQLAPQPAGQRGARPGPTAQQPGPAAIRVQQAVVVGINGYPEEFHSLANSVADASAVARLLVSDYGFTLLPGGEPLLDENATTASIQTAIAASLQASDSAVRWLFYFAGHGFADSLQGYLIPSQAEYGNVSTYISLRWLLDTCINSECGEALIILDACYAGLALLKPDMITDLIPSSGQAERVRLIVTSGNPDQPVLDSGGSEHSVFTQSLLEALRGWAGIHEVDGSVRFLRLLDYLALDIPNRLRAMGLNTLSQQPVGGYIIGNRERRDFHFQAHVPRLDPELVQGARSTDPQRRKESLLQLPERVQANPSLRPLAVELTTAHLAPAPGMRSMLVAGSLMHEPEAANRAAAALALGALSDPAAVPDLLAALADVSEVFRAAARALEMLRVPDAAARLVEWLPKVADDLLEPLAQAIGASGAPDPILQTLRESLNRGKLVPFIGPDAPQEQTGVLSRATFTARFADHEGLPYPASLAQVAEAATHGGQQPFALVRELNTAYNNPLQSPGSFYQALSQLNAPFWISACYDNLLAKAINGNLIVTGEDTRNRQPDGPTVVRLAGDLSGLVRGLVILQKDYEELREDEDDRNLLLGFLKQELEGKIVLLLGFDPSSPDFILLSRYILNQHLAGCSVCAYLAWPAAAPEMEWGEHAIHQILREPIDLVSALHISTGLENKGSA